MAGCFQHEDAFTAKSQGREQLVIESKLQVQNQRCRFAGLELPAAKVGRACSANFTQSFRRRPSTRVHNRRAVIMVMLRDDAGGAAVAPRFGIAPDVRPPSLCATGAPCRALHSLTTYPKQFLARSSACECDASSEAPPVHPDMTPARALLSGTPSPAAASASRWQPPLVPSGPLISDRTALRVRRATFAFVAPMPQVRTRWGEGAWTSGARDGSDTSARRAQKLEVRLVPLPNLLLLPCRPQHP